MKWLTLSWLVGRVRGVEIRFHFSMLFSVIIAYLIFRPASLRVGLLVLLLLIGFVLSIFLHEVGHAVIAKLLQVEVKSIVIWLLGGFTNLGRAPEKPLHRLAIDAAGPLVTILLGLLFVAAYSHTPENSRFFSTFFLALAILNISLFVFNILPVYPLDGGNILHALIELFFGKSNANLITLIVSIPVLFGLIVFGIYVHDYILLAFSVIIALSISTLNRHTLRWTNLGLNYLFKRGAYYVMEGDYDRAEQYYALAIQREPGQANHYVGRAVCYLYLLQYENALADVERALTIAPKNEMALGMRGDIYLMKKDSDSAFGFYESAHKLNPNSAFPYFGRGSVMMEKEEFPSALEEFNKAISLLALFPLFYVVRSMVHFRLGNLEAAHNDQDSALRLSEKDSLIRPEFNLQMYEGYLDWAEDYYARVILKWSHSWYAFQGRADAYRMNGEHDKAIIDYTHALKINPREPRLYLGRGKSYKANLDINCAMDDFYQVPLVTDKLYLKRQAEELLMSLKG